MHKEVMPAVRADKVKVEMPSKALWKLPEGFFSGSKKFRNMWRGSGKATPKPQANRPWSARAAKRANRSITGPCEKRVGSSKKKSMAST
jgi:hypothetical protein